MSTLKIELKEWEAARPAAAPLRYAAFLEEKDPPAGIELDDKEPECLHAVAFDEGGACVGTARLHPDGLIGRLIVHKDWRRRGAGEQLLKALIEAARQRGHKEVTVHAGLQAAEFYREHGFAADGKVFKDGAALQQKMRLALA